MTEPIILHTLRTESTMDDARSAVRSGAGHWTVCSAGSQSAGRGRVPGRKWEDSGESLLFTLILERDRFTASYPPTQMLALALCLYLEKHHSLRPRIKWPNDVLVAGKKLAGILVETEREYFLAGMGVSLNQRSFPGELRRPAVSLRLLLDGEGRASPPDSRRELHLILEQIEGLLDRPADIVEVAERLDSRGREVTVILGDPARNESLSGVVTGLQDDGALLIRTPDGKTHPVYSGEMSEKS